MEFDILSIYGEKKVRSNWKKIKVTFEISKPSNTQEINLKKKLIVCDSDIANKIHFRFLKCHYYYYSFVNLREMK